MGWKKGLKSGHILKTKSTRFADRPDWGQEAGRREESSVTLRFPA